jgi:hypothetical protein
MTNVSQDKNRIIAEGLHQAICDLRDKGIRYTDIVQFHFYVGFMRFVSASFHSKPGLKPIQEEQDQVPCWRCWFR